MLSHAAVRLHNRQAFPSCISMQDFYALQDLSQDAAPCTTLSTSDVSTKHVTNVSFLRFKIQDDEIGKDDLAAWACIRLDRLQAGYRFVRLLDAVGAPSQGILLVKIEKSLT